MPRRAALQEGLTGLVLMTRPIVEFDRRRPFENVEVGRNWVGHPWRHRPGRNRHDAGRDDRFWRARVSKRLVGDGPRERRQLRERGATSMSRGARGARGARLSERASAVATK